MYLDSTVETPENMTGISKKKIKGTTYIYYEHGRRYDPTKKYNVPQCTTIGKQSVLDHSMMTRTRITGNFSQMPNCRTNFLSR